jgi:hypothetical protein
VHAAQALWQLEPRAALLIARARQGMIDGQAERLASDRFRARHDLAHQVAIAQHVELEPQRAGALGAKVFDRGGGERRHRIGHAGILRAARDRALTLGMKHAGIRGRRQHDRQGVIAAEKAHGGVEARDVDERARTEADPRERLAIRAHGDFVADAGGEKPGRGRRHPRAGALLVIVETDEVRRRRGRGRGPVRGTSARLVSVLHI